MWNSEDSVDLFYVRMLKQKSVHVISSTLKARHRPHLRTSISIFLLRCTDRGTGRSREVPSHFTVNGGRAGRLGRKEYQSKPKWSGGSALSRAGGVCQDEEGGR